MNRIQHRFGVVTVVMALAMGGVLSTRVGTADAVGDPDATRPSVWTGATGVAGVQVAFDPEPFLPVSDIVNVSVPEGFTEWSPTQARARAAPLWPGGFATGFPNLLLPFLIGTEAPPYPVAADAKHPDQPDAGLPGGIARAHAGRDFVEAAATYVDIESQGASFVDVGSIETLSHQEWDDGILTARAETLASDVRILNEIVIKSVETVAIARSNADGPIDAQTKVTLGEVTVAGVPAVIDEDGISLAGEGDDGAILGAAGPAARQASEFLAALGQDVQISLVGGHETVEDAATAQGAGLLITVTFELVSPTGSPLPGDQVVLTVADAVFSPFPDDLPKTVPPGPNVVFRNYFGTITIGNVFARTSAGGVSFDFGDLVGLFDGSLLDDPLPTADAGLGSRSLLSSSPVGVPPAASSPASRLSTALPESPSAAPTTDAPLPTARSTPADVVDSFLFSEASADRVTSLYGIALLVTGVLFALTRLRRAAST
ncbi:MAG TPA: hypothetical protein VGA13_01245 [Acidimicrobiales bacterium]